MRKLLLEIEKKGKQKTKKFPKISKVDEPKASLARAVRKEEMYLSGN